MKIALPLLLAALVLGVLAGSAAEEEVRLDGLHLGQYWYGARITKKDLLGKVVLVEYWGS